MPSNERPPVAAGYIVGDTTQFVRTFLEYCLSREDHDPSIYYFGIVSAACYLESVLEDFTFGWCQTQGHSEKQFLGRLMEKVGSDVNRATGLDGWKQWLKVLFDVDFPSVAGDDWPNLKALFTLRNQLAHGRTTKFPHFWNATNGKFMGMTLEGSSYKRPFEHLLACGAIKLETGEVPSLECIFTHNVLLHFLLSVNSAIEALAGTKELMGIKPDKPLKLPNKTLER